VAVIGLGGVGSWAAEALCRSGIGNIVLIDMDDICISNTNRQLHALTSTVGKSKIQVMKNRLLEISPDCNVTTVFNFVTGENAHSMLSSILPKSSIVLDAIDGKLEKAALLATCSTLSIPVITCGASAGRIDPTKVVYNDITQAKEDRLLFWVRKELRQKFSFPKGPASGEPNTHKPKKWSIGAVYSTEVTKSANKNDATSSFRTCDGPLGTACFVTGTYGFIAAGKIVEMIAQDKVVKPFKRPE